MSIIPNKIKKFVKEHKTELIVAVSFTAGVYTMYKITQTTNQQGNVYSMCKELGKLPLEKGFGIKHLIYYPAKEIIHTFDVRGYAKQELANLFLDPNAPKEILDIIVISKR